MDNDVQCMIKEENNSKKLSLSHAYNCAEITQVWGWGLLQVLVFT